MNRQVGRSGAFWAAVCMLAVTALARMVPLSSVLVRWSPEGALEERTQVFLDEAWMYGLLGFVLALIATAVPGFRAALAGLFSVPKATGDSASRSILLLACLAFLVRVVVGEYADVGFGDDGARIFWLLDWLERPHFVSSGLWAPGHLYLHALIWVFVHDAVRAGVILSALASAGTVWLLSRAVQRNWGKTAGRFTALFVALMPVSVAFGSTADVNPVFAFFVVAAIVSVERAQVCKRWWLLVLAWLCMAFAEWIRFEAFLLVPALAVLLWPDWRKMIGFGLACLLPTLGWSFLNYLESGDLLRIYNAVSSDTALEGSRASQLFSLFGALWLGLTLPMSLLGSLGVVRALRAQRGREGIPVLLLHLAALCAATWVSGTGNQARYFILAGALLCGHAGVAIAGVWQVSRLWGGFVLALALALIIVTPSRYAHESELWLPSNPKLRAVVDCIYPEIQEENLIWVAGKGSYFYPARHEIPASRYHAISRTDSDLQQILTDLTTAVTALACVGPNDFAQQSWSRFMAVADDEWEVERVVAECNGFHLYRLVRTAPHGAGAGRVP